MPTPPNTTDPWRWRIVWAGLAVTGCFVGQALRGEPCQDDRDCQPSLRCGEDGLCGEFLCPAVPLEVATLQPDVTLLVAYTVSMARSVGDDGQTRWDQVRELVTRLAEALGDDVQLGLQVVPSLAPEMTGFFDPCYTDTSTQILPGPNRTTELPMALAEAPPTLGEHALRAGLALIRDGFELQDDQDLRPQAVVLISDPPFNCSEAASSPVERVELFDDGLAQQVAEAAAADTPVFVVGVGVEATGGSAPFPGAKTSEVDPHLAFVALAEVGGRARTGETAYYRPEDVDALISDLRAIPPAFADCRVRLDIAPAYPQRLVVTIAEDRFRVEPTCETGHGWRYTDPTVVHEIELCPITCAAFRERRALTIEHRCPSE